MPQRYSKEQMAKIQTKRRAEITKRLAPQAPNMSKLKFGKNPALNLTKKTTGLKFK